MRRLRRRSLLCKHCVASARRKNYSNSFLRLFEFPRRNNLLGERLESWITAQWVKEWINSDLDDSGLLLGITSLEPVHRLVFVSEPDITNGDSARPDWRG